MSPKPDSQTSIGSAEKSSESSAFSLKLEFVRSSCVIFELTFCVSPVSNLQRSLDTSDNVILRDLGRGLASLRYVQSVVGR
jgi:hypothetical protein